MFEYNRGTEESDIIKNKFTAYIMKSIRRKKFKYLRVMNRIRHFEQSLEALENTEVLSDTPDMLLNLPVMDQIGNETLHTALEQAKPKDRCILFAKVLEDRSFIEIGVELGIKPNTAAKIYYRLIKSLRERLEVRPNGF